MVARRFSGFLALAALVVAAASAGGTIEGRWRLVEQSYGAGRANLADRDTPLRIEFRREGGRLVGRTWIDGANGAVLRWPALPGGPTVEVLEIDLARDEGQVRARYRTESAPGEEGSLEIVESYRVSEDGGTLSGSVSVTLLRGDGWESGGSYTLHRRFVREP